MILSNLTSPANNSPTIMATSINGSLSASLIKTTNIISNIEQIYIALEDTTTGVWDRIMIFGGRGEFNYVVGTTLSFQSMISCSIQITPAKSIPQKLENLSFSVSYSYSGIQGLKLSIDQLPEFNRSYTRPLPFGGYNPFPYMDTNGTIKVAAFYVAEKQRYEIFIDSGTGSFEFVDTNMELTNCVYLKFNGLLFELFDGVDVWTSLDGIIWTLIDLTSPVVILTGLPATIYDIPKLITVTFNEPVVGFNASNISLAGCTLSAFVVVDTTTFTFNVTATGATTSVWINAGVTTDLSLNPNVASNVLSASYAGVATPISAGISANPVVSSIVPQVVSFNDATTPTSGETISSWAWDFGDGTTSTIQNPAHSYTLNGSYIVTLTSCDNGGCDTTTTNITVDTSLATLNVTLAGFVGTIQVAAPISVTIVVDNVLSLPITSSDFISTNVSLSNLILATPGVLLTDPQTYTIDVTPITPGAISLELPAGVTSNMAGISNNASNVLLGNAVPIADKAAIARVRTAITSNVYYGAGSADVVWHTTDYDIGGWWTSGSTFTVPVGVNIVVISMVLRSSSYQGLDDNYMTLQKNGVVQRQRQLDNNGWIPLTISAVIPVAPGDMLKANWWTSGGTTMGAGYCTMTIVGYE